MERYCTDFVRNSGLAAACAAPDPARVPAPFRAAEAAAFPHQPKRLSMAFLPRRHAAPCRPPAERKAGMASGGDSPRAATRCSVAPARANRVETKVFPAQARKTESAVPAAAHLADRPATQLQ